MIEGTLEIRWANRDKPANTRTYWVRFMTYAGFQHGAQPRKEIVSQESLLDYLIGIQAATMPIEQRTRRAREWLLDIHSVGHLSLDNAQFTEEQYEVFRPTS